MLLNFSKYVGFIITNDKGEGYFDVAEQRVALAK